MCYNYKHRSDLRETESFGRQDAGPYTGLEIRMKKRQRRRRTAFILLLCVILAAAAVADSNFRIVTTEYEIESADIPASMDGFRIVQLSDIHASEFGEGHERLVSKVEKARPDIIVITGDMTDEEGQIPYAQSVVSALAELAPVYYVSGNHEWATGEARDLFSALEDAGAQVLRNEYVTLGNGEAVLVGLDDPNGPYDMPKPDEVLAQMRQAEGDKYTVVLNHRNHLLSELSRLGADLVLSGHAHGGIVRLPFTDGLIGPSMEWFPTHTSGVYTEGECTMVVSRGLGNTFPTFRVFNNPHIPVIVLRSAQ